jgi:hypothetical protein
MTFKFEGERAEEIFAKVVDYAKKTAKNWDSEADGVIEAHNKNINGLQDLVDKWVEEHKNDGKIYFPEFTFNPDVTTKITILEATSFNKLIAKILKAPQAVVECETGKGTIVDLDGIFNKPSKCVVKIHAKYDVKRSKLHNMERDLERELTIEIDGDLNTFNSRIASELGLDVVTVA